MILNMICLTDSMLFADQWQFIGLEDEKIMAVAISPITNGAMYAGSSSDFSSGTYGKIFKSLNGGDTWEICLDNVNVRGLSISSINPEIVFATLAFSIPGVVKSINGGLTWTRADSGISLNWETSVGSIAIAPSNLNIVYVGTGGMHGGSLYKTSDGGDYWTDIGTDITDNAIRSIVIDPTNSDYLLVGTIGLDKIFRSNNAGLIWEEIASWSPAAGINSIVIDPSTNSTYYAGVYQNGLYKSLDSGATWFRLSNGLTEDRIRNIEVFTLNTNFVITGTFEAGIFISEDAGQNWTQFNEGLNNTWIYSLAINTLTRDLFCGTSQGIYKIDLTPYLNISNSDFTMLQQPSFILSYPNPFNPVTTIQYKLPQRSDVQITIYDLLGREVTTLVSKTQEAGIKSVQWDATNVPSGMYFYQIRAGEYVQTRKMVLLK